MSDTLKLRKLRFRPFNDLVKVIQAVSGGAGIPAQAWWLDILILQASAVTASPGSPIKGSFHSKFRNHNLKPNLKGQNGR